MTIGATETTPGNRLLAQLPLFTDPLDTIGSVQFTRDADGQSRLVGEWPTRMAMSIGVLDVPGGLVRVDGLDLHITAANATATYRAIGRTLRDDIVADRGEWRIEHQVADPSPAQADRDALRLAAALTE